MNRILLYGKLVKDAERILINTKTGDTTLINFQVLDAGMPYQKSDPLIMDVSFLKEAGNHIFEYLKEGKEVYIDGFMKQKTYKSKGEDVKKYYLAAEYVGLLPMYKN